MISMALRGVYLVFFIDVGKCDVDVERTDFLFLLIAFTGLLFFF